MRRFVRPILIFLAVIFLIEVWLWDRLEPVVARIVNVIPWHRLKRLLAHWIDDLPPAGTLVVFIVPVALLIPVKLVEVWFFYNGDWLEGVSALLFSKLLFIGTTAFVFDVTRDKLLQLDWFRVLYDYVLWLRDWAHRLVDPIKHRIQFRSRLLAPTRAPRAFKLLRRIRRRIRTPAEEPQPGFDRLTSSEPTPARTVQAR
jgi:hypothetical protein